MPEYIRSVRIPVYLLVLIVSIPLAVAAPGGDDKPNIVLVLMDNFGYGEIGVYGGGILRGAATPNIDGIAAEGFQLTNFNVEAECTPSRSALMTGRYGIRTRQRQDGPPRGVWYGITKWEITLAEMLSDSRYATGIFGKWHLGDTEGRYPTDQGFDEWYGIPRSSDRAFWPDSNSFAPGSHPSAVFTHVMSAKRGQAEGIDITADIYPYPYWQSTLTVMFPERDFEDPVAAEFAVTEVSTPEGMLIPVYKPEPSYAGKTLAEISEMRGTEPAQTLMDLIRDAEAMRAAGEEDVESVIATSMDEDDIARLMAWEHTNIGSDGALDGAHPRGYGTYARVLGRYVRERDVLTLPQAVRKSTSLAAEHMGFADRGRIASGFKADLVLFDPDTVIDRATPQDPHAVSVGIERVWVNGVLVYTDGGTTDAYPGRVLRR